METMSVAALKECPLRLNKFVHSWTFQFASARRITTGGTAECAPRAACHCRRASATTVSAVNRCLKETARSLSVVLAT